jgi:hypothetical protein
MVGSCPAARIDRELAASIGRLGSPNLSPGDRTGCQPNDDVAIATSPWLETEGIHLRQDVGVRDQLGPSRDKDAPSFTERFVEVIDFDAERAPLSDGPGDRAIARAKDDGPVEHLEVDGQRCDPSLFDEDGPPDPPGLETFEAPIPVEFQEPWSRRSRASMTRWEINAGTSEPGDAGLERTCQAGAGSRVGLRTGVALHVVEIVRVHPGTAGDLFDAQPECLAACCDPATKVSGVARDF